MSSYIAKPETVERKWYVIDADGVVLGRLASQVALMLRGKHKPTFTPHVDTGDYIIVVGEEGSFYELYFEDETDGNIYIFFPHDCNTFRNGVCTIAVNFCTKSFRISCSGNFFYFICIWIIFCFNKSKSVDTGNDLSSVFS